MTTTTTTARASHADCAHPRTKAERAICRKVRRALGASIAGTPAVAALAASNVHFRGTSPFGTSSVTLVADSGSALKGADRAAALDARLRAAGLHLTQHAA